MIEKDTNKRGQYKKKNFLFFMPSESIFLNTTLKKIRINEGSTKRKTFFFNAESIICEIHTEHYSPC